MKRKCGCSFRQPNLLKRKWLDFLGPLVLFAAFEPSTRRFCRAFSGPAVPTLPRVARSSSKCSAVIETVSVAPEKGVRHRNGRVESAPFSEQILETNLKLAQLARQYEESPRLKQNRTLLALEALRLLRTVPGGNPDTVAYNSVLKVLSRISPSRLPPMPVPDESPPAAETAEHESVADFAEILLAPPAKSATAAEWARALLEEMKVVHARQSEANLAWYRRLRQPPPAPSPSSSTLASPASAGPPRVFVKPNVRSYSTVMDAYARLGTSDGCDACLDLLAELEEAHRETGDPAYRPNAVAYNTCLSALARARRPEACWDLFLGMPVDPDIISVNVVLHSVARSGWSDAGDRAQAIMDNFTTAATAAVAANETKTQANLPHDGDASMASPVSSPALRSNARTFSTCMDAWSRCGRPDRALGLLDRLLELHDATGDERYRPNCVPFATVIHAYSVSGDADRTSRAAEVFRRMKERGVPPNAVVLNNLLNCYASRPHPDTAGTVETLYRYISDKHPGWMDSFTFGITLKAVSTCRVVFWRDNPGFAPEVFRECCRRGLVTPVVLWQLRQAVPAETFREILASAPSSAGAERGSSLADVGQIPREWRRHVDERKVLQSRRRRR